MAVLPLGTLIWVAVRPLLRLILCAGFGFCLAKADIFPIVASRGAGQIIINVFLPCLMFSKIIPAFSIDNISTLGPLFLLAFIYEGMGLFYALVVKQFFWVPYRFRYGLLAAGIWGNWGDIPTSVVMSITAGPPFNGTTDQTLAVAYVSAFVFVFNLTLFPMNGYRLIAMDFDGPDVEDQEMRKQACARRHAIFHFWQHLPNGLLRRSRGDDASRSYTNDVEKVYDEQAEAHSHLDEDYQGVRTKTVVQNEPPPLSHSYSAATTEAMRSLAASPALTTTQVEIYDQHVSSDASTAKNVLSDQEAATSLRPNMIPWRRYIPHLRAFLISLASPPSLSIIVSFPIALIPPLKALFVPTLNSHIPNAPDGQPPLAFIIDTATFVGAASVPTGLIVLGSAFARLKVPTHRASWRVMPVGAITALGIAKIALGAVFGVLICEGFTRAGVIDRNDRVLRFVCIFFSCLPTATSQVYLTQVYSTTGSSEHIAAFLAPQYLLLAVVMTILTAYSLNLIF